MVFQKIKSGAQNLQMKAQDIQIRAEQGNWLSIFIVFLLVVYLLVDCLFALINYYRYRGVGYSCRNVDRPIPPIGPFSIWENSSDDLCDDLTGDQKRNECENLGEYNKYKTKTADDKDGKSIKGLCKSDIDKLVKDTLSNNLVGGYNSIELLTYVIIPTTTILGIIWGLISTRLNRGEWTFWIMIATLIFTSLSSISYNTDLLIIPEQTSPLSYITDRLELSGTDELKYSFIARRKDGEECLVDGMMLGSGITPENDPPSYNGFCDASNLPL
jgi:hypothetical protein